MSETKRDYEVGRGNPPMHTRFKKGQSGNPRGPRPKNLPALLAALNEPVYAMIDGKRGKITKRKANRDANGQQIGRRQPARTKMLFGMMKEVEHKTGTAASSEPSKLTTTDREVVELFVARLRRQIAAEAAAAVAAAAADPPG